MFRRLVIILVVLTTVAFLIYRQPAEGIDRGAALRNELAALKPQVSNAAAFAESPKVSDLADKRRVFDPSQNPEVKFGSGNIIDRVETGVHDTDASVSTPSASPMPTPSVSFEGLINRNNGEIFNVVFLPSDSNGDVGPNHYFQVVNTLARIFDKQGNPLTPPFKLSDIFTPLGTVCATRNDGSAVVLYDPLADRWLVSQYCNAFPPFRQMIAVSKTGDPLGAYHIYEFVMPNVKLNDYAKFGVWPDAYYMSTDEFLGSDYAGAGLFAFDREKILDGDPTAAFVYFNMPSASIARLGGVLPADLDGLRPPPAGTPGIFAGYSATEYGAAQDALRLFEFRVDFNDPFSSTLTERADSPLVVAAFDPTSPDGRGDIAQPAPGDLLDSVSDRLMYRVAYRNFGSHESLVFNQTVRMTPVGSTYRAGVRVYELRRSGGSFSVYDQTTFGTTDQSRWVAAAAQDHQGNIAFGYSAGNEEKAPSISYTGRLSSEPVGSFRSPADLIAGTGVQTAFGFRWGNFSSMTVDVSDDCTFWLTNQHFSAASQAESPFSWLTRIGSFKYEECAPAPRATISGSVTNSANGAAIADATITANDVFSRRSLASGNYGPILLLPGDYSVTVSAPGFRTATSVVTVSDDQNAVLNFSLDPVVVAANAGSTIISESCAQNGAPEPGETVGISLALRNAGSLGATSLTATLQATNQILNPSPPQTYGTLPPGGISLPRNFTFTVSSAIPCGSSIALNFKLADGAADVGEFTTVYETGSKRIAFSENFDDATSPALPAGWTTSATGGQQNWTTSLLQTQTAPNSVFSPGPNQVGLNELVSPVFPIVSPNAEIEFRNWYELETTFLRNRLYDGSVLEIKIGAGDWQDIETAGGLFTSGGYDGTIDGCCQNPLAGRRGWSGRSGVNQTSEFITSRVRMPASAAGNTAQLRWRVGTDVGTFRTGQFIDNLVVTDGSVCQCSISPQTRAPFDFDGDGRTDLGVFRPTDVPNAPDFVTESSASGSSVEASWGSTGDIPVTTDFDGDGKADFAVFRPSSGVWFVLRSIDSTAAIVQFGLAADVPVPADFDGDERSDVAVYRPSDGIWYMLRSSDAQVGIVRFGLPGDQPVQADYDGDAKTDQAVYRPSDGNWYILRSSDLNANVVRFGLAGDKPVAGDFDGDGRADFTVFRPSDGVWYILRTTAGFGAVQFGLGSDKPLQADFDGDGKRDVAVFRPSDGVWYHLRSSDGDFRARQYGQNPDIPLAGSFVP